MLITQYQPTTQNPKGFTLPNYQQQSISNIPNHILHLLHVQNNSPTKQLDSHIQEADTKNAEKIVLIVMDGFGFDQLLKHHKQNPFLTNLAHNGDVSPITSVYPSQTTNALTTLNTGLTPQEHGVFEYFLYLKEIGIVNTLRFERIYSKKTKPADDGFSPKLLFRGKTIHQTLKEKGISTFTHMNSANAFTACSKLLFNGSTMTPALKTSDLIVNLRKNLENIQSGYFFVHIDSLDTISHEYGPESDQYAAELSAITFLLQKELVEKIKPETAKETLLLITADHGSINVNPDETTYLDPAQKPLTFRQVGKDRKRIHPTGSPRDIFLHIKEEKVDQTKEALEWQLGEKAQVIETKAAIKAGLFGLGKPSKQFIERAGNLLIIPHGNENVWFKNPSGRRITFLGQHGGLSAEEMLVPFAVANLCNLRK
ncbi:MAG: alkaline phosphatase family protein [Candidatus Bathyarchaeia archaeon]|jgi:predicted AlkP superfamily pyrophosphatase or phosphodiesterase